jgi:hypothetical protein
MKKVRIILTTVAVILATLGVPARCGANTVSQQYWSDDGHWTQVTVQYTIQNKNALITAMNVTASSSGLRLWDDIGAQAVITTNNKTVFSSQSVWEEYGPGFATTKTWALKVPSGGITVPRGNNVITVWISWTWFGFWTPTCDPEEVESGTCWSGATYITLTIN